jgi:uncharacterized protein (TIGR00299 family) protein
MTIGALLDLGVPRSVVDDALKGIGVAPERLSVRSIVKTGIAAVDVKVDEEEREGEGHAHHHYSDIRKRIQEGSLAGSLRERILKIFDTLARAEAKLHATTVEKVAFHEVGGIDSIVDIVGSAAALEWLSPASVSSSPVAMGTGTVRCAHGLLPVPSPAALEIMREVGGVTAGGGIARELCTPTGAAILAATVEDWGQAPDLSPVAIGYGAGDAELDDRPNVLRVTAGRRAEGHQGERLLELAANIDDMSGELCGAATDSLLGAGAAEVWWTPTTGKKSRPAWLLSALVEHSRLDAVVETILSETTSIGVRYREVTRRVLDRSIEEVKTEWGAVQIKVARLRGVVCNAAPEFDDCQRLATQSGVPVKQVYAAAIAAWEGTRADD